MSLTQLYTFIIARERLARLVLALGVTLLAACSDRPKEAMAVEALPPIYPDYIGVTIPPGIAPMNFNVTEPDVERVYVEVTGAKGGQLTACGDLAAFDCDQWHVLTEQNAGSDLTFTVFAKTGGKWRRYLPFKMHVGEEPLDAWGLTYRRIAPGYEVYSSMGIYQRDLSSFDEYPLIENTRTSGQCYNCHTSNRTDPAQTVMHVRGSHGATLIRRDGSRLWLKPVNDTVGGAMVYPYWHPSGRYCAFSTNQTRQGFHIAHDKRIEVFDLSSDVLVYDAERNEIIIDSLLASPVWSENIPVFSPDGRSLYFTTAEQRSYPQQYKSQQYDLCRVDFDPATGSIGQQVDTLFKASALGKSVTWPRPSYDGRYLMFSLIDYGYFSVWHSEADQWLLDLATGAARPLDELNSADSESFHNWSADSRWVVFTSRRDDGLYTRLYLAAIDSEGRFSKPFMLPQLNPKSYYDESLYSFNTPDFTSAPVDFGSREAAEEIASDLRVPAHVRRIP